MIITYTTPPNLRESFIFHGDLALVGRISPDARIDLNLTEDNAVSRLHAAISFAGGEFWVEDLGSSNGTLIDGKKISHKTLIPPGAKVTIGRTILEIRHDEIPQVAAQPQTGLSGDIAEMVDAAQPPFFTLRDTPDSDALSYAVRQLEALHDLGRDLGSADTIDGLLDGLRKHVQHAIPTAQRGAVLLNNEQGMLLMKAHWPSGQHSVSMTWAKRASHERQAFIWSADQKEHGKIPQTALLHKVKCAIYAPLIWGDEIFGVVYVDSFADFQAFNRADLDLLRTIAEQTAMFIEINLLQSQLRDEERVQASLLRQFSPHMVQRLLENKGRLRLGGERADPVTVLMADVRGFTALSAQMEPDVLVQMLNEMYNAHIPIIFKYDGTVDKYEGDSFLAVFGSPEPDEDQWHKAVAAGLEIQMAQSLLALAWQVRGLPACEMGVGIHTGSIIHGFLGSDERMEFTVIGQTVNQASRVTDSANGGEVVISQAVYEHIYRSVKVQPKLIPGKHAETESDLTGFVVERLNEMPDTPSGSDSNATFTA